MATVLDEYTNEKQRSGVLSFLWVKIINENDINKGIFPVYGGKCLSRKAVHNWTEKFSQGRSKIVHGTRPGCPVEIATEGTVQRVEELIRADRRLTIHSVATALGYYPGLAYSIKHDRLKLVAQRTERSRKI
jgi:hypothetical protein